MERSHLRDIQAVNFDMDGLMLDTERVERKTFLRAARELEFDAVEEVYVRTIGRDWPDTKGVFADPLGPQFPYDQIRSTWRSYTEEHIAALSPIVAWYSKILRPVSRRRTRPA
jgi:beta-phosphoglucomutase-like phosphatase (HAD superfamily)